jgi:DNA-binding MarR family transcriptional regulator
MPDREPPEAVPLQTSELAELLRAVIGRLVRSTRRVDVVPAAEAAVLGELDRGGQLSVAELARRRRVRHQTMSTVVARLQARGLVQKSRHATDARTNLWAVTQAGRAALERDRSLRADWLAAAIDAELGAAERSKLVESIGLLSRLADHT